MIRSIRITVAPGAGGRCNPAWLLLAILAAGAAARTANPAAAQTVNRDAQLGETAEASIDASNDAAVQPMRLRLEGAGNLGEALDRLREESDIEFEHAADPALPFDAPATPLTFWQALDTVLDQAGLEVDPYAGGPERLSLIERPAQRRPRLESANYAGVFRFEPTSVTARRLLNQPRLSGLNLGVELSWRPTMTPIGLTVPVRELTGTFSNGEPVKPQTTEQHIEISAVAERPFSECFLPLELPAGHPQCITTLRGNVQAMLPGERHAFEFPLAQIGAEQKRDRVTVRLQQVRPVEENTYEVRLSVQLDQAGRALESHRRWIFQNPVFVRDRFGQRIESSGWDLYQQTESRVALGYRFQLDSPVGANLIYQTPTSVIEDEIAFELDDIPLP
jgi:hypothetical protein